MERDAEDKWRYTKLGDFPLVEQEVLVFVDGFFAIGYYIGDGDWYLDNSMYYNRNEDIAWRPLPEEPKRILQGGGMNVTEHRILQGLCFFR